MCDLCLSAAYVGLTFETVRFISLRVGSRRVVVRLACCVHQFSHLCYRRRRGVVLEGIGLEGPQRMLLVRRHRTCTLGAADMPRKLLQCVLESRRPRRREDPRWRARLRRRLTWRTVRLYHIASCTLAVLIGCCSHEATPEIWTETYLSALLRAILYSDDPAYWLEAYRKLDPITTPEGELRFLQAAEDLFLKGWQVGSDPEIQVATVVSNHLTNAIMKYFGDSGRFQYAANLFEKLSAREPEVSSLLGRAYIGMSTSLSSSRA